VINCYGCDIPEELEMDGDVEMRRREGGKKRRDGVL
jgi:hypothetical protein